MISRFGCDYVLPKIDMIAVPDMAAGAMENWVKKSTNRLDSLHNTLKA
jgi:aminopeptidase N